MNKKTKTRRICDLADSLNERIKKASGLTFRDQVLIVAGFLAGFFGLQAAFVYIMWGFIILTTMKFILLSLAETESAAPELEQHQQVPPHQPIPGEFDVFAAEPEPPEPEPETK